MAKPRAARAAKEGSGLPLPLVAAGVAVEGLTEDLDEDLRPPLPP